MECIYLEEEERKENAFQMHPAFVLLLFKSALAVLLPQDPML